MSTQPLQQHTTSSTTTSYRAGQRAFGAWLSDNGIRLRRTEDHGLRTDGDKWEHFAYTMHVAGQSGEVFAFPYMQGTGHTARPKLIDLMGSLLTDAQGERSSFDAWAHEYGYDTDSRRALDTFNAIAINNGQLLRLFGVQDLDALVRQSAPLLDAAGL